MSRDMFKLSLLLWLGIIVIITVITIFWITMGWQVALGLVGGIVIGHILGLILIKCWDYASKFLDFIYDKYVA